MYAEAKPDSVSFENSYFAFMCSDVKKIVASSNLTQCTASAWNSQFEWDDQDAMKVKCSVKIVNIIHFISAWHFRPKWELRGWKVYFDVGKQVEITCRVGRRQVRGIRKCISENLMRDTFIRWPISITALEF